MTAPDFIRLARLHRHRRGRWEDFWAEHRSAIAAQFPATAERKALVERLMECVLMGTSGGTCEEIK